MPRELKYSTKEKLVKKLNEAFDWDLVPCEFEVLCYSTSGAFRWVTLNLSPQICCEDRVTDFLKSEHISFVNGGYKMDGVHVSIEDSDTQNSLDTSTPDFNPVFKV